MLTMPSPIPTPALVLGWSLPNFLSRRGRFGGGRCPLHVQPHHTSVAAAKRMMGLHLNIFEKKKEGVILENTINKISDKLVATVHIRNSDVKMCLGNKSIRALHIHSFVIRNTDNITNGFKTLWRGLGISVKRLLRSAYGFSSLASMLTRTPRRWPMLAATITMGSIMLGHSTSMLTIPSPIPTPTLVLGWSLPKPIQDSRLLRCLSTATKFESINHCCSNASYTANKKTMLIMP